MTNATPSASAAEAANELAALENRLQMDLQAVARLFMGAGMYASAIRVMGFQSVIASELGEVYSKRRHVAKVE